MALNWIDHFARVRQRHIAQNLRFARLRIHLYFRSAEADLPKGRRIAQRNVVVPWNFVKTASPNLPFGISEVTLHDFPKAQFLLAANSHPVLQANIRSRRAKNRGCSL